MQFKTKQERNRSRERRRRNITFLNLLKKKRFILDLIKTLLMTTGHDITNAKSTISKRKEEKKGRKERKEKKVRHREYGSVWRPFSSLLVLNPTSLIAHCL